MIDFCIDFLDILAPLWEPSWGHVGHFFEQNGGAEINTTHFFVGSMLFSDFFPRRRGVPHRTVRWGTQLWFSFWEVFGFMWAWLYVAFLMLNKH